MSEKQSTSWDLLAGVRFALAGIVLVTHTNDHTHGVLRRISDLGAFAAVVGFLILSGYSIAHSYGRSSKGFYSRRMLRIYPLYALAILFAVGTQVGFEGEPLGRMLKVATGNLFFLQTYRYMPMPGNAVIWTIAVEATFYLLTPIFARLPFVAITALAGVSAAVFAVYPLLHLPYFPWTLHGMATLSLGWAWLAGFIYYRHRTDPAAGVILTAAVIGLSSINSQLNGRFAYITLLATLLALTAGGRVVLPAVVKKVLGFLGDFSYPLYLFHPPAFLFCYAKLHTHSSPVLIAAGFVLTAVVVTLDLLARKPLQRGWAVVEGQLADAGRYVLARPWVGPIVAGGFALPRWVLARPEKLAGV